MRAYGVPREGYQTPPYVKVSRAREHRVAAALVAEQLDDFFIADESEWFCEECQAWGRCSSAKP